MNGPAITNDPIGSCDPIGPWSNCLPELSHAPDNSKIISSLFWILDKLSTGVLVEQEIMITIDEHLVFIPGFSWRSPSAFPRWNTLKMHRSYVWENGKKTFRKTNYSLAFHGARRQSTNMFSLRSPLYALVILCETAWKCGFRVLGKTIEKRSGKEAIH